MNLSWIIGEGSNAVLNEDEKIGGILIQLTGTEDFEICVGSCDLLKINYRGSRFTCWNSKDTEDCIFERLDRVLINQDMQNWYNHVEVEHLSCTGSDHAPMLFVKKIWCM